MSGDSKTTLNSGSGGDNVYVEDIGGSPVVKMPASKIHTGALGVDGGPVTTANPLPVRGYDGTNATFPTGTAAADAESASTVLTRILSRLSGYNGSTHDLLRAGLTAATSTLTGYLNLLPFALYKATRPTLTDGQGYPLMVNSQGDLTFQGAKLSVAAFTTLALNGQLIKTGAGTAYMVFLINTTGAADFAHVFDATATQSNGTVPLQTSASTANNGQTLTQLGSPFYGLPFSTGLWLQASTTLQTMTKEAASTANAGFVLYL